MTERKTWTDQEDDLLRELQKTNQSLPEQSRCTWGQISDTLNLRTGANRTGKQCRQRWHNQLDPLIVRDKQWSPQQEDILFHEQDIHGNKWALIAQKLHGRTDNNIKNYFYSTLRKALRKINCYLSLHKKDPKLKNVKTFKQQTLSKILAVADKKYENKVQIKNNEVEQSARRIKNMLIQAERNSNIQITEVESPFVADIIDRILEFNRNCKRRKSKKRETDEDQRSENSSEVILEELDVKKKQISQYSEEERRIKLLQQLKLDSNTKKPKIKNRNVISEHNHETQSLSTIKIPQIKSQIQESISNLQKLDQKSDQKSDRKQDRKSQQSLIFVPQNSAFRRSSFKQCPQPNTGTLFMGTNQSQGYGQQSENINLFPIINEQSDLFKNMRIIEKKDNKIEDGFILPKEDFNGILGFNGFSNMFERSFNYGNDYETNTFKKIDGSVNLEEFLSKFGTESKKYQIGK